MQLAEIVKMRQLQGPKPHREYSRENKVSWLKVCFISSAEGQRHFSKRSQFYKISMKFNRTCSKLTVSYTSDEDKMVPKCQAVKSMQWLTTQVGSVQFRQGWETIFRKHTEQSNSCCRVFKKPLCGS